MLHAVNDVVARAGELRLFKVARSVQPLARGVRRHAKEQARPAHVALGAADGAG